MQSIVSYPERGAGGNSRYRGNCSPKLIEDLITQYKVKEIADYMCGSGTTEAAAKGKGIISHCYDLNRGFDLINHDIPERSPFIFWHPPYGDIITYSDVMYKAADIEKQYGFDPREFDLSRIPKWDDFVKMMNYCMIKQYLSLEKGGRMAVLVGDIKKKGKLYSMIFELAKPGTIEQCIIKMQHNCVSDRTVYDNRNFVPIVHEYVLVVRKDNSLVYNIQIAKNIACDTRNLVNATWREVVAAVFEEFGRKLTLTEIYNKIDGHKKAAANHHWKEKVRQTLQINPKFFTRINDGVWALA